MIIIDAAHDHDQSQYIRTYLEQSNVKNFTYRTSYIAS